MITLQLTPELWKLTLVLALLLLHKPAYNLISRMMDRLHQTPSWATPGPCLKSPDCDDQPNTPRISAFHRRFRSSIPDSRPNALTARDPPAQVVSSKNNAARSAKRLLISTVRDDWEYPPSKLQTTQPSPQRQPVEYRVREDGSSDPEFLSDEPYDARDPMVFNESDPYKFESPDAVVRTVSARQRRRRRMLQDELQWNEGLRTWTERRNAWCGVVEQKAAERVTITADQRKNVRSASESGNLSSPPSPYSQVSATSPTFPSSEDVDSDGEAPSHEDDRGPLLPVFPSLIPEENLIRASIKPPMYSAIYSKVVLQGLTPTVPVPLTDMVGALVQGWKSEGNWPPQSPSSAPGSLPSRGRRTSELLKFRKRDSALTEAGRMRKGVGAVKKVLRLRTSDSQTAKAGSNLEHRDEPAPDGDVSHTQDVG